MPLKLKAWCHILTRCSLEMLQNNELKSDGPWLCYKTHLKKKNQKHPNPLKQGIVDFFYFLVNMGVLQHLKML